MFRTDLPRQDWLELILPDWIQAIDGEPNYFATFRDGG